MAAAVAATCSTWFAIGHCQAVLFCPVLIYNLTNSADAPCRHVCCAALRCVFLRGSFSAVKLNGCVRAGYAARICPNAVR